MEFQVYINRLTFDTEAKLSSSVIYHTNHAI
jgi:hypothetical protein